MREIKFRAWDYTDGGWIRSEIVQDWFAIGVPDEPRSGLLTIHPWSPNRFELMQYTGLKDKKRTHDYPNGQDIFEGDVVKVTYASRPIEANPIMSTGQIRYRGEKFYVASIEDRPDYLCFYAHNVSPLFNWWELEVIGNIYENPELLKSETQETL